MVIVRVVPKEGSANRNAAELTAGRGNVDGWEDNATALPGVLYERANYGTSYD